MGAVESRAEEAPEVEWPEGIPAPEVLASLPPEMREEILLKIPPESLRNACATNQAFWRVCTPAFIARHTQKWRVSFVVFDGGVSDGKFFDGDTRVVVTRGGAFEPASSRGLWIGVGTYQRRMVKLNDTPSYVVLPFKKEVRGFLESYTYFDGTESELANFPRLWMSTDTFGEHGVVGATTRDIVVYSGPPYEPHDVLFSIRTSDTAEATVKVGGTPEFLVWKAHSGERKDIVHLVDMKTGSEFATLPSPNGEILMLVTESGWIVVVESNPRGHESFRAFTHEGRKERVFEFHNTTRAEVKDLGGDRLAVLSDSGRLAVVHLTHDEPVVEFVNIVYELFNPPPKSLTVLDVTRNLERALVRIEWENRQPEISVIFL